MLLYYQMVLGKSYAIFDLPRICKNLVLFPIESLLLILFLNVITPLTYRMKLTYEPPKKSDLPAAPARVPLARPTPACATGRATTGTRTTRATTPPRSKATSAPR